MTKITNIFYPINSNIFKTELVIIITIKFINEQFQFLNGSNTSSLVDTLKQFVRIQKN